MQLAAVNEADVGRIAPAPGHVTSTRFRANSRERRQNPLNATMTQNVVMYTVEVKPKSR